MKQADEQGEVQEGRAHLHISGETRVVNFVLPEMTLARLIWFQMHDTVAKVMEASERPTGDSLSPRSQNFDNVATNREYPP
jgi:hypothetical protein